MKKVIIETEKNSFINVNINYLFSGYKKGSKLKGIIFAENIKKDDTIFYKGSFQIVLRTYKG